MNTYVTLDIDPPGLKFLSAIPYLDHRARHQAHGVSPCWKAAGANVKIERDVRFQLPRLCLHGNGVGDTYQSHHGYRGRQCEHSNAFVLHDKPPFRSFSPAPFLAPHLNKRKIRRKTAMLKGAW